MTKRTARRTGLRLIFFAYLFFLSIEAMGMGMKLAFKGPLTAFLQENAASFTELMSFVVGILGTSVVQSSSTVTSLAVVLTQEHIVPLVISIGIVHGANLGTSVTSSLVALFSEAPALPRNPLRAVHTLLVAKRPEGFERAVSTAVVHGLFNAILVTLILLTLEIPFGLIRKASAASASVVGGVLASSTGVMNVLAWASPKTWTKPVVEGLLSLPVPGLSWADGPVHRVWTTIPTWSLVLLGFVLLFAALRGFSRTMKAALVDGGPVVDVQAMGRKLVGTHPLDTFARGLLLTILVQSSSATTSMVVPLAAMGLFNIRQILPFILGANIGTTTTALLAASAAIGQPGFEAGLTIALSHFYLNTLAVILVATVSPLRESVLGTTAWLARGAARTPMALVAYLGFLAVVMPVAVYMLPNAIAITLVAVVVAAMLIAPHVRRRTPALIEDPDELAEAA